MKLLPSCHDVQTHLTDYTEGALPLPQRLGIWVHLLMCRVCAAFLRGLETLPGMAKTSLAPPLEPSREVLDVLAQVQALIRKS